MKPDERVQYFLDAMADWERRMYPVITQGATTPEFPKILADAKKSLQAIHEEHLTNKGKGSQRWGKQLLGPGPSVSTPPQYDQQVERVEDGPKKSAFYVKTNPRKDPNKTFRYTVTVDAKGESLVDDVHVAYLRDGKVVSDWSKTPC